MLILFEKVRACRSAPKELAQVWHESAIQSISGPMGPQDPQIPQFYWCLVRRAVAICFGKTRTPGKHFSGEGLVLLTTLLQRLFMMSFLAFLHSNSNFVFCVSK